MENQILAVPNATDAVLLKKKVVSSAGVISIFGIIQIPASTLTMTETEVILEGPLFNQTIPYDQIEKVEIKPFLDWKFTIYKSRLLGKGVKIWKKGAPPDLGSLVKNRDFKDLLNVNLFIVIIINPDLVFDILKQKRSDLFVLQS